MSYEQLKELQVKKYFRAKELAEFLGIGLSTVWLYTKQGKIEARKLSNRVTVFDINEVKKALGLSDEVA